MFKLAIFLFSIASVVGSKLPTNQVRKRLHVAGGYQNGGPGGNGYFGGPPTFGDHGNANFSGTNGGFKFGGPPMGNFSGPDDGHSFGGNIPMGNFSCDKCGFGFGGSPPIGNNSGEDGGSAMMGGQFGGFSHPPRSNGPGDFLPWFEKPNATTIDCHNAGEPVCSFNPRGDNGTWVCRTLFDLWTGKSREFTACIDPQMALASDGCGCCGGSCPSQCTCDCVLFDGTAGVRIKFEHDGHNQCVPSVNAIAMVAMGGFSCATNCSGTN